MWKYLLALSCLDLVLATTVTVNSWVKQKLSFAVQLYESLLQKYHLEHLTQHEEALDYLIVVWMLNVLQYLQFQ